MPDPSQMTRHELLKAREQVQRQMDVLGGPMRGSIHDTNRVKSMAELRAILEEIDVELGSKRA
jgi:hypothetical protein